MKNGLVLTVFVALLVFGSAGKATEFGGNIMDPNYAGFEEVGGWVLDSLASRSSDYANNGSYSLKYGPTSQGPVYPMSFFEVTTVANRKHFITVGIREPEGELDGRYLGLQPPAGSAIRVTLEAGGTDYFRVRYGNVFLSGSGSVSVQCFVGCYFSADSYDDTRAIYFDDFSLSRECVKPAVDADSKSGVLPVGVPVTVILYNSGMPVDDYKIAFDPDITIDGSNCTVGMVNWISDYAVSVELIATSPGDVSLTLTNVYSNKLCDYIMAAVNPLVIGDAGTQYLTADVGGQNGVRDGYVNLYDLAVVALQWMDCTNPADSVCDFNWHK